MAQAADYYDRVNETLLDLMPLDCGEILEVGCGAGALAARYKRRNPWCKYYGIESHREAGDAAWESGLFEDMVVESVEDDYFHGSPFGEDIDCLVFGDVLEHLNDPWDALKETAKWVREGGQVLASIPNVGHYAAIISLLKQEWPLADEGVFDRTHLRWFTRQSAEQMFRDAGLTVVETIPVTYRADFFEQFRAAVGAGRSEWEKFGVDLARLERESVALQHIIRAVKGEPPRDKLLIRPFPGPACCARPRLWEPLKAVATIPGVRYAEAPTAVHDGEAVVVVRQRANWKLPEVRGQVAKGCLVVGEWDDQPDAVLALSTLERPYAPLELLFRGCHAIMVSTGRMAETVRAWNPEVAVFPNQILELPPPREYHEGDGVRIFFGAQNRQSDWAPIMPALNRVLKEHEDRAFVVVVNDRAFYDATETRHKAFHPFLPYDEYRRLLRSCDLALLPLEPTPFNEHKSDIKFIECAAEGVAAIVRGTVYDGFNDELESYAYFYGGETTFETAFRRAISVPDERRRLVARSYAYVRDRRLLASHYKARLDWFRGLVARKAELDEALKKRAPELFEDQTTSTSD